MINIKNQDLHDHTFGEHMASMTWDKLLQQISNKLRDLLNHPEKISRRLEQSSDILAHVQFDVHSLLAFLLEHYDDWLKHLTSYVNEALHCITSFLQETDTPDQTTIYHWITQQHALARHYSLSWIEAVAINQPAIQQRLSFFTKQWFDAISPEHCLLTNPDLLDITLKEKGCNLLRGFLRFLSDFDQDAPLSLTDTQAFHVGGNLAITPGKVIFRNALMELIQYTPQTPQVRAIPLLIIPPWINKYYILDLNPTKSLVRWLVAQGITVFMISWINPHGDLAHIGLDDYLSLGSLTAINVIQTQLSIPQVNALGFCIGGTLLSMTLAYYHARQQVPIHSATLLATLIDFSDPGDLRVFINEDYITFIESRMKIKGYLDGHVLAFAFHSLRAKQLIWPFLVNQYVLGKQPEAFDLLFWNTDSTNLPQRMHSEYLRWLYLQNDLIKPNKLVIRKTPLDLHTITTPTFFVATENDHIAPWRSVYQGFCHMRGSKQFLLGGSGHIAGIVVPPGSNKYGYYTNPRHPRTPDAWLKQAIHHPGSWWPTWSRWLLRKSGHWMNTTSTVARHPQSDLDAPGEYVFGKTSLRSHALTTTNMP